MEFLWTLDGSGWGWDKNYHVLYISENIHHEAMKFGTGILPAIVVSKTKKIIDPTFFKNDDVNTFFDAVSQKLW